MDDFNITTKLYRYFSPKTSFFLTTINRISKLSSKLSSYAMDYHPTMSKYLIVSSASTEYFNCTQISADSERPSEYGILQFYVELCVLCFFSKKGLAGKRFTFVQIHMFVYQWKNIQSTVYLQDIILVMAANGDIAFCIPIGALR